MSVGIPAVPSEGEIVTFDNLIDHDRWHSARFACTLKRHVQRASQMAPARRIDTNEHIRTFYASFWEGRSAMIRAERPPPALA